MTDTGSPDAAGTTSVALLETEPPRRRRRDLALVLILTAQLMVAIDATIANIALPHIGADLGISQANLTWIVTGYALAFGGLLLLGGRLGDLYGRRRLFMTGLTIFAIASLLGGVAISEGLLIASRGLQGVGAALATPAALALITTTFPAGPQRNRAMAAYATMSGIGAAIGLILGGWLTGMDSLFGIEMSGWRLTFLINVPIGLVAAVVAPRVLSESETHPGEMDVPGAITGTLGLLGIVFGLSRAGEEAYGWGDVQAIAPLAAGIALLTAFAVIESRVEHPLLPIRILANRTRGISFAAILIAAAAMYAMFYFVTLFNQRLAGYSPLEAGFAFLPFSLGIVLGAGVASKLLGRIDPRHLAGTGTVLAAFALFMFSRLSTDDAPSQVLQAAVTQEPVGSDVNYWTSLFPWLALMAIGLSMTFVTLTLTAVHSLRAEESGVGSGMLNTMQQVGGALGLATLSTVSLHFMNSRADEVTKPLTDGMTQAKIDPSATVPGTDLTFLESAVFQASFTEGATNAFFVGSVLTLAASALVWLFLDVKHTGLATEHPAGAAADPGYSGTEQRRD